MPDGTREYKNCVSIGTLDEHHSNRTKGARRRRRRERPTSWTRRKWKSKIKRKQKLFRAEVPRGKRPSQQRKRKQGVFQQGEQLSDTTKWYMQGDNRSSSAEASTSGNNKVSKFELWEELINLKLSITIDHLLTLVPNYRQQSIQRLSGADQKRQKKSCQCEQGCRVSATSTAHSQS